MSTLKYLMWLSCLTKMKPKAKLTAIEHFGSIETLFFASPEELARVPALTKSEIAQLSDKNMDKAMRSLEICQEKDISIVSMNDIIYPSRLRNIYDPPIALFVIGKLPHIDEEVAVGIVGTRKSTAYGDKIAAKIGYEITKCGGLIVSGLAMGIDAAGAIGALQAGGSCVGVLGTAIDEVSPPGNRNLFLDVARAGAIVSEYPPLAEYVKTNFPNRNRIISGLSLGVLVVEAPLKSGALITAERAIEQGRDIFVVPGNIDAYNCEGSNELMKDCAKPITSGYDVVCEYSGLYPNKVHKIKGEREKYAPDMEYAIKDKNPVRQMKPLLSRSRVKTKKKREAVPEPPKVEKLDIEKIRHKLEGLSETQLQIISILETVKFVADDIIHKTEMTSIELMGELAMLELAGIIESDGFGEYTVIL